MTEIALLKFLHILGLVYWLGADLGVYYSSYVLCDREQAAPVRVSAGKILFALDQVPRICMVLMLPLGVHLGIRLGYIDAAPWVLPATWAGSTAWLAMVLVLHFRHGDRRLSWLPRFDSLFRLGLVLILAGLSIASWLGALPGLDDWAATKLAVFAALVFFGLLIRFRLKAFGPAFLRLARGEASDADHDTIARSIAGTRPWVLAIWAGLLLNTALGVHLL